MDYITVSAKTLDDAITEALIQLGVTSDQLDYEVIEKGSPGFLGIGMKQAVIKARRKHEEPEVSELDELLNQSDIISLHCPCTEETRHIINDSSIANMKDGVIIVNTSRGPLIELDSLVNALDSGKVAAAGLDVFEGEPITDLTNKMYECENLIITPHSAYYSCEAATDQMTILANTAVSVLKGSLPKNCLNREAL